ncbi:MAG: ATP-binding protein, partial [Ornithinimicrobium sp.]
MSPPALPLMGRTALQQELGDLVRQGRSVLLRGPAGVGKTRLVAEVCREPGVAKRPLDRLLGSAGGAALHLSTLAPLGPPDVVAPDDIAAVHGHFLRRWRERGGPDLPALVWLDDAQHVDPLSAAILRQALVTGVIQLIGTHRTTEPLGESMTALHTEALLDLVVVPPLDRGAADRLASAAAAAELTSTVLDRVHDLAAGNPLFIREIARDVGAGDDSVILGRLEMIVGRPVMALPPRCRHTLELVAVAEPIPERLLSPYQEDVRELRQRGFVMRQGESDLRVDHPLRRAWVLLELGTSRTVVLRQLLDLVDSQGLTDTIDPVAQLDWQLQAGRTPEADNLQRATRHAIARLDGPTSLRFAAAMTGPTGELLRGEALVISGRLHEGLAVLADVARAGPIEARVEAAYWQARYLGIMLGEYPRAQAALDAVDVPELPPSARRVVFAGRLWLWIFGPVSDPEALDSVTDLLDAAPLDEAAFEVAMTAASLTYHTRDPEHARVLIGRLRLMQNALRVSDDALCRASTVHAWWHIALGDVPAALRAEQEGWDLAKRSGNVQSRSLMAGSAGLLVAQTGRVTEALHISGAARNLPDTADWFQYRRLAEAVHLGNLCLAGRVAEVGRLPEMPATGTLQRHPDLYPLFLARARHLHE